MSQSAFQKRVLIVENDLRLRKRATEVLASDYQIFAVEGTGAQLLENAEKSLVRHRIHLAVLDLRLIDENDEFDQSGYDLALRFQTLAPHMLCLFFTGIEDFDFMRKAMSNDLIFGVIVKEKEGWLGLLESLNAAFKKRYRCNWNPVIEGLDDLRDMDLIEQLRYLTEEEFLDDAALLEEFVELIGKLFPHAERVRLQVLDSSDEHRSLAPAHSLVLKATQFQGGYPLEPVALKVGRVGAIRNEHQKYEDFVRGRVQGSHHTTRDATEYTWHLGGIAYLLARAELDHTIMLQNYYGDSRITPPDLEHVFQRLFQGVSTRWSEQKRDNRMPLVTDYLDGLGLNKRRLGRIEWDMGAWLEVHPLHGIVRNPLGWLEENAANSPTLEQQNIVHGDLHSRNIFVDDNKQVWLIDFERTGYGHSLRDIIELETDILFRLLEPKSHDLELFARMCIELLAQDKKTLKQIEIGPSTEIRDHPQADRAFRTITLLRKFALDNIMYPDLRDYFWGLLVQTLYVATLPDLSDEARERTKLAAALLCARLGNGKKLKPIREVERLLTPRRKTPR